jgi:hypothetical protein
MIIVHVYCICVRVSLLFIRRVSSVCACVCVGHSPSLMAYHVGQSKKKNVCDIGVWTPNKKKEKSSRCAHFVVVVVVFVTDCSVIAQHAPAYA